MLLCHFGITLLSCKWQPAAQDRALLPSWSSTKLHNPFGKNKAILLCSPSRGHSAHTKYTCTLPGQVTVLLVFHLSSQTAANISCCRKKPRGGQLWSNLSTGEYAFWSHEVGAGLCPKAWKSISNSVVSRSRMPHASTDFISSSETATGKLKPATNWTGP